MIIHLPTEAKTCPTGNPTCRKVYNRTLGVAATITAAALGMATVTAVITKPTTRQRAIAAIGGGILTAAAAYEAHSRFKK